MRTTGIKYQFTVFLFFAIAFTCQAQYKLMEDKRAVEKMHQAIDSIYNLNFDAADVIIDELEKDLGDYPGMHLLKAFYTRWKFQPIKKGHESFELFESYLLKGIEKSEQMLQKNEEDAEASFFLMACHAFLAELYVNNGGNFKALGEAKSAYKYIKFGFDYTAENPEFFFSSGIYNYYREKYPEENPFYKSFVWFFRSGDMEEGIYQLKQGADLAVFTRAECLTYLFHIYLRYEDNPADAIFYSIKLKDKYPNNLHYISNFVENKIRLKQYDRLLPYIERLMNSEKKYYKYLGEIFYGHYLENHENLKNEAMIHYNRANELGKKGEIRIPHYDSILFLGIGRIHQKNGEKELGTKFLKKSVKTAEYIAYRKDAEALLKN